jgi:glycosyltransferase involved in cell wall biosynthesis
MQKILYIITLPDWGGAQRYVFDLANKLQSELEGTVAFGKKERNNELETKCIASGIKIHQFSNLIRPINPIKDIRAVFELAKYINATKPDTIHLNSSKAGIIGSLAAALSKHKPEVIYTVHGWVFMEPMSPFKKQFYIFLERLASQWRDKIIVLGEKEKQIALQYKICPEKKLEIVHHAIQQFNLLTKKEAREKLNLPQDKKIIGTIANFFPSKGLSYLIEAAAKINNPDIIFAIIGDGTERHNYELLTTHYSLQTKLFLLGEKENAAQYLKAFDVFVLPSVKEGAPYVILEAMAAELPIIATDVGNISEMMKGYINKTIVPPADVEALVRAIEDKME